MAADEAMRLMEERLAQLYAQHDADQQRLAAAEVILRQVAGMPTIISGSPPCPLCGARRGGTYPNLGPWQHTPACPVTLARAWLATAAEDGVVKGEG